jgi:hypothetical protein
MASGRRFAWQNKPQFAIRPDEVAAAKLCDSFSTLIRPVLKFVAAPND